LVVAVVAAFFLSFFLYFSLFILIRSAVERMKETVRL
jgi:hypothetical protein